LDALFIAYVAALPRAGTVHVLRGRSVVMQTGNVGKQKDIKVQFTSAINLLTVAVNSEFRVGGNKPRQFGQP
jgi:hypothetical protein